MRDKGIWKRLAILMVFVMVTSGVPPCIAVVSDSTDNIAYLNKIEDYKSSEDRIIEINNINCTSLSSTDVAETTANFDNIKLYLTANHTSNYLSEYPNPLLINAYERVINNGDYWSWGNYSLKGDINGTSYSYRLYLGSDSSTTFKIEIIINGTTVATFPLLTVPYDPDYQPFSGNVTGLDPTTSSGDEVMLKITKISGGIGSIFYAGTASYITIPPLVTQRIIQSKIDAAEPGDTILIEDGIYNENVKVNKWLTIQSKNGSDKTIIQAMTPEDPVFNVTADYVNISGITVKGADTGIYLYNADYCNISDNNCSNNLDDGIALSYSNNNDISNNKCSNNGEGIYLYESSNNLVKSNNVSNNGRITAFVGTTTTEEVREGMVRRHITTGMTPVIAANGISLFNSSKNEIYLNNFINNSVYSFNSTNIWSSPSEIPYSYNGSTYTNYLGNYWDDYKKKYPDADEINGCGIWDTPYDIDSDKDNYPLAKRFENYSIIPPATTVSDGYVELTLNKMERTDTVPPELIRSPLERARQPEEGHDFVVINLTLTRIEGRYVLTGSSPILFDDKGNSYTCGCTVQGISFRTEKGEPAKHFEDIEYAEAVEGSKWLLISEMPKDREPVRLRFIYSFTESWEKISVKEGQIEMIFKG